MIKTVSRMVLVSMFAVVFITLECDSWVFEEFYTDECYHGDDDIFLSDLTYVTCLDECRAREKCIAFTFHVETHDCRLHLGTDLIRENCHGTGFLFSRKTSWEKKQIDGCVCSGGETCNTQTMACEVTECPFAEAISNGKVLGNRRFVGSKIEYICNYGYNMTGSRSSICRSDGTWSLSSSSLPTCVLIQRDCPSTAPTGTNTNTPTVIDTTPGSTIQYQCIIGYQVTSPEDLTLTCSVDGEWGLAPDCWRACPITAPTGTNTNTPVVTSTTPGSTIQYQCFAGYQVTSQEDLTLTCAVDGIWGSAPECWKDCPTTAPTGTNTNTPTVTGTTPGSTIQYQCMTGYQVTSQEDLTVTCTVDGIWGPAPECWKPCSTTAPTGTSTNTPTVTDTTPGSTIQYQCMTGYQVTSQEDLTLTCAVDGIWGSAPDCWKACSSTAPTGTNTNTLAVAGTTPGSTIQYQCITGYQVTSPEDLTLTCSVDGEWGPAPDCWKVCATTAPTGTNTNTPTVTGTTPGSTIQYQCIIGYQVTSQADLTLTCSVDGDWGRAPDCWKACPTTLPTGTNTNTPTVTGTTPGSTIQYLCITGYQLTSPEDLTLTCSVDGEWGSAPNCWKACPVDAPAGINTVHPVVSHREPGTVITYTCKLGHTPQDSSLMEITCSTDGTWGTPPTCVEVTCDAGWTLVGGRCRQFISRIDDWSGSKIHCESIGGYLAHIISLQDLQDILTLLPCVWATSGCYPWFGINDIANEGTFSGVIGQNVSKDVVDKLMETNHRSADCSYFSTSYRDLRMFSCGSGDSSFCEK